MSALPIVSYPFNRNFYNELLARRDTFEHLWSQEVQPHHGFGFRAEAGQVFRLTLLGGPQILDTTFLSADDPDEYCEPGIQAEIEGFGVTRLTRLWGTPPLSRPLATCIANTVKNPANAGHMRDHFCHTSHCTPHIWELFNDSEMKSCYDNLCEGLAMVGLGQRCVRDNLNLFMKGALDPTTGALVLEESDSRAGDYLEFYAEVPLYCVFSVCPAGRGPDDPKPWKPVVWEPLPVRVDAFDAAVEPLGWPYIG